MSTNYLTPENIIAFRAKNGPGNMIRRSIGKNSVRKNNNPQFPTSYLSLQFQTVEGNWVQPQIKFIKQVIAANAKTPPLAGADGPKFINYTIKKLTEEMLRESEYRPEDYANLLERNECFVNALNILNEEFILFIKKDVIEYDGPDFSAPSEEISSFIQDSRKANAEDKKEDKKLPEDQRKIIKNKIKLDTQLIRFRIPIDVKTKDKRIGVTTKEGTHIDIVYDARKPPRTPAIIKQKVGTELKDMYLTADNASTFITYMSLTGGIVDFELSVGEKGNNIQPRLRELHVAPHRKLKKSAFADDEFSEMRNMATNDTDAVMDEPVPGIDIPTKTIKTREKKENVDSKQSDDEQEDQEEVNSNDGEPQDRDIPSREEVKPEVKPEPKEEKKTPKIDEPVIEAPKKEKKKGKKGQ